MIEIRWHGRGGQGAFTAAKILGAASLIDNKFSLAFPSFGPERRGAPIQAFNKIDGKAIIDRSEIKSCDYLIFLDDTLFSDDYLKDLKDDGIALINTATPEKFSNFSQIQTIDANPRTRCAGANNVVTTPQTIPLLLCPRVDPTRGVIRLRGNRASSIYHAPQTSIDKR